jgi:hypothetical protein
MAPIAASIPAHHANWPSFCGAVAVYAAGGMTALAARRDASAVKLLSQMK